MAEQHENQMPADIRLIHGKVGTQGRLTLELINQINVLCDQLEDVGRDHFGVLLLTLESRVCCLQPQRHKDVYLVSKWEKLLRRIELCHGAVIISAGEHVGHLGLALLLVADYRVLKQQATLSLVNQQGHILPGCALQRLAHQYGSGLMRQLVLFGKSYSSERALQAGLVDELAADSTHAALGFIEQLSAVQLADIRVRRQLMLEAFHHSHDEALGAHLAACDRLLRANAVAPSPAEETVSE